MKSPSEILAYNEAIQAAKLAAIHAVLPDNYQWGSDAMEQFTFGKERAADAIAALTLPMPATPPTQAWKLVPVEPTREMWAAAGDAVQNNPDMRGRINVHHDIVSETVYRAMLAAAPAAPAADGLVEQGRCETTLTERYANPKCICGTYPDNLGPCLTFGINAAGRCVYCDHDARCHLDVAATALQSAAAREAKLRAIVTEHPGETDYDRREKLRQIAGFLE